MIDQTDELDDIPGTILFDGERSRQGYRLNKFLNSLNKPENRKAFLADQPEYLSQYHLSEPQLQAVLRQDWNALLELGGNIFYIGKLAICLGLPFQQMQAAMSGMSYPDYLKMMMAGGRGIEGNRSKKDHPVR